MQMQIVNVVQTNLSDHDVFWTKQKIQIINENSFDDEHAHLNEILLHLDQIRIDQNVIIFQRMMRRVRINIDSWLLNNDDVKSFDHWVA